MRETHLTSQRSHYQSGHGFHNSILAASLHSGPVQHLLRVGKKFRQHRVGGHNGMRQLNTISCISIITVKAYATHVGCLVSWQCLSGWCWISALIQSCVFRQDDQSYLLGFEIAYYQKYMHEFPEREIKLRVWYLWIMGSCHLHASMQTPTPMRHDESSVLPVLDRSRWRWLTWSFTVFCYNWVALREKTNRPCLAYISLYGRVLV